MLKISASLLKKSIYSEFAIKIIAVIFKAFSHSSPEKGIVWRSTKAVNAGMAANKSQSSPLISPTLAIQAKRQATGGDGYSPRLIKGLLIVSRIAFGWLGGERITLAADPTVMNKAVVVKNFMF